MKIDLDRYAGKWYEIAKYPVVFEPADATDITASYRVVGSNRMEVVNTMVLNGRKIESRGTATSITKNNRRLVVDFGRPMIAEEREVGNYWILMIDCAYQWVVVGSNTRTTLWILARQPTMDKNLLDLLLENLIVFGYDASKVVLAKHGGVGGGGGGGGVSGTPTMDYREVNPSYFGLGSAIQSEIAGRILRDRRAKTAGINTLPEAEQFVRTYEPVSKTRMTMKDVARNELYDDYVEHGY